MKKLLSLKQSGKRLTVLLPLFTLYSLLSTTQAQDPQLSQFYAAPLYLNPAFTGNLDYECRKLPISRFRGIANYRSQWGGNFGTAMASVDYRSKNGAWGFGVLAYQDKAGVQAMTTNMFNGLASYKAAVSSRWNVHMGLQIGYGNRVPNDYTFPDQFNSAGLVRPTNEQLDQISTVAYPTASAGVLAFNEKFYIGSAVHNINQPNLSTTGQTDNLPMRFNVHTGYRIPLNKSKGFARRGPDRSVIPTIHYKKQGPVQQLDVGSYFNYEPLVVGAWFRGLPIITAPDGGVQKDVAVLMLGVRQATDYGLFKLGVSYDFPLSVAGTNSGRTWEVSLSYQIIDERCRKRITYRSIPCPGL